MSIERNKGEAGMEDERGTSRLEAFSDGVFAIAVTLLVLDIKVPEVEEAGSRALMDALWGQWTAYAAYVLSFVTIGIVWANHHRVFANIVRTNHSYLIINVVFLMLIGVFPFPTALLSKYIEDVDKQAIVTEIYTGLALLISITHAASWVYAKGAGHLLRANVDPKWVRGISLRNMVGVSLFGVCFLLSFVNVYVSLGLLCLMVLFYLLPGRLTGVDRMG